MTRSALARRVAAVLGLVLAVAIAVPVALVVLHDRDARSERFDARLSSAMRDVLAVVGEKDSGGLDLDTYLESPRAEGAPETAVISRRDRQVAGDRPLPAELTRVAVGLLGSSTTTPQTVGQTRLVAQAIEGTDDPLGGAIAYAGLRPLHDEDGRTLREAVLLGLGGWLLLLGAGTLGCLRLLGSAGDATRREQAFLADAGHELRTPWAVVASRANEALREDGQARTHLQAIEQTALAAGTLIGDMLELARLQAGHALGERVPVRLDALARTACDDRAPAAEQAGVSLMVHDGGPTVVDADPGLLMRAVGNLVDNALRHGAAGGRVRVEVVQADGRARVIVADVGRGIPPAQRERIFERFARASSAGTPGAGLGLPIARLVAEAHDGTLRLEDAGQPAGARFVLELPAS